MWEYDHPIGGTCPARKARGPEHRQCQDTNFLIHDASTHDEESWNLKLELAALKG